MRILFLANRVEDAGSRHRFLHYIPYLEKEGWSAEARIIPARFFERLRLFGSLGSFDAVFLHRRLLPLAEWHVLRRAARRVIFDFDDAVMFRDPGRSGKCASARRMRRFARTVAGSDAIIAGNGYLRELALKYNPNTAVVPTSIDMKRYAAKDYPAQTGVVTLGWVGRRGTLFYLERMKKALDAVALRHPRARLKIVADAFFDCERMPVEKKPWSYDTEAEDIRSFDIGLMPLTDDPWSRGKCGFKLLQYMAAGVPGVASPVGVNAEIIEHGRNGFLAESDEDFAERLAKLIEDPALRRRMGAEARRTVIEGYSLEVNAPRLLSALRGGAA